MPSEHNNKFFGLIKKRSTAFIFTPHRQATMPHDVLSIVLNAASCLTRIDDWVKTRPVSKSVRHFFMAIRPANSDKGK
jgi:hypothetical protein